MADHDEHLDAEPDDSRREAARQRLAARQSAREEAKSQPLPEDAELVVYDPKFCLGCGEDLSELPTEVTQCPRCGRGFDPHDPSTYTDEPPPALQKNFWLQRPRIAGYLFLFLLVLGRIMIYVLGGAVGGRFGDVLIAFGVLVMLPWIFVCVYLALEAAEEIHNPTLPVSISLGVASGFIITLGMHPALIFCGLVIGGFTGFFRAWREI